MELGPVAQLLGESPANRYEKVAGGHRVARDGRGSLMTRLQIFPRSPYWIGVNFLRRKVYQRNPEIGPWHDLSRSTTRTLELPRP